MFHIFYRLYDDELKVKCPGITDKDIQINRYKDFARWIKEKVSSIYLAQYTHTILTIYFNIFSMMVYM